MAAIKLERVSGWRPRTAPTALWARTQTTAQATVEFALLVIPLLMLVMGIVELGRALYVYSALTNAARVGARYAIVALPTDAQNCATSCPRTTAIKDRARGAVAIPLTNSNVTVQCAIGDTTSFSAANCTSSLTTGDRVQVSVTYTFQTVVPAWIHSVTIT